MQPMNPTPSAAEPDPDGPARSARFDLRRSVLVAALALIVTALVAVAAAVGVWLAGRTRDEIMFAVAVVWLVALTVLVLVHDHPTKGPKL